MVRQDKTSSKLRIVYDASAKSNGPSLNDCLYTGPKFDQSIFDILLRFRVHKVALAGDIEKAFLMVSIMKQDRDSLRFLWIRDIRAEIIVLRFTRVVFGVKSSPFLLNATIHQHMQKYREVDPSFVDTFLSSIYVDDVSIGSADVDSTYELYLRSKLRLSEVGFRLRKFTTNSEELWHKIEINERLTDETSEVGSVKINEDDQSYTKESLGVMSKSSDAQEEFKILGVQ